MRLLTLILAILLLVLLYPQTAFALSTYDVGYNFICKAIFHNGKLYFTSSANYLVVEYDTASQQTLRTWPTADYAPTQVYLHPDGNRLFVTLNRYIGLGAEGGLARINLTSGAIDIFELDEYPLLNLVFSDDGASIFATSGYHQAEAGMIVKIDCNSGQVTYFSQAGDYPLGLVHITDDQIITSCADFEATYYSDGHGTYPGPPYFSKLNVYTDIPRLAFKNDFIVSEDLNYIKKMDITRFISVHMPTGQGPCLCIYDGFTGAILNELEVPEIAGVLDTAYSPVTGKVYATVVVDAGNYDPETEVPELAYCGHLLVYDPVMCSYNLYENYFDSQVSMINLDEGLLVINSINSSKIYLETPFY